MSMFEHYMYVLECGDGSLYTGYTTDVDARVAAHQAGTGAKYTKSHAPVQLIAQARFHSKERAMSAEAHFKQLDRKQKDALIAQATDESGIALEDVLCAQLEDFGEDTAIEFVNRSLSEHVDLGYKDFNSMLIPNVEPKTIAGVRTPDIRKIAKALAKRDDKRPFLKALPHHLFEENQVHAFTIALEKDYDSAIELYDAFLPYVDNWATCDQLPVKTLAKDSGRTLEKVNEWLASGHCYTIRFGIGVLMRLYLDDLFDARFLDLVAGSRMPSTAQEPASDDDVYYVDMMRAWFFAEALAKQESAALPYLKLRGVNAVLDEWTRRKAIQKAIESRRISDDLKAQLRSFR